MANNDILHACVFMHPVQYLYLYFVLSLISINYGKPRYYDSITLTLEGQDSNEYSCRLNESQISQSVHLMNLIAQFKHFDKIVFDPDVNGELINGLPKFSLPYDAELQYLKTGFKDMCNYLQNADFNEQYRDRLPMPLLLENSNDFYSLKELTNQEILSMQEIESFNNSNDNNDPFNFNMTRMNNLFKIAQRLEIKRLFTMIAGRHASLMTNMNKPQMIEWLFDIKHSNSNEKNLIVNNNNNENAIVVPLFTQNNDKKSRECTINPNDLNQYNFALVHGILPFLSYYDIHTFVSISDIFYNRSKNLTLNIDSMIKKLTNNDDAACLSLIHQELIFYKPFLTLPQSRWSKNQNNTYNQLSVMTNNITNIATDVNTFYFDTLSLLRDNYRIERLQLQYKSVGDGLLMKIIIRMNNQLSSISLKFGKFAQKLNSLAQSENIDYIGIEIYSSRFLSSFNDVIGINDINNIKSIQIMEHSFSIINIEEISRISNQLEYLNINSYHDRVSVKNVPCLDFSFLHSLPNLKDIYLHRNQIECIVNFMAIQTHPNLAVLDLAHNKISSLDLNAFHGTNIKWIDLSHNQLHSFSSNDDTPQVRPPACLDFNSFNNMHQLQKLHLRNNNIQCMINFESIQQHTRLKDFDLSENHLLSSVIDFTTFDKLKPKMNSLFSINFRGMNLKSTNNNNDNCFDLQFLKFMPNVRMLYLSNNNIECIENCLALRNADIFLDNNNLQSFDFADLIGTCIDKIYLRYNNLSFESLKNFDINTLSQINPSSSVNIFVTHGNDDKLKEKVETLQLQPAQVGIE